MARGRELRVPGATQVLCYHRYFAVTIVCLFAEPRGLKNSRNYCWALLNTSLETEDEKIGY